MSHLASGHSPSTLQRRLLSVMLISILIFISIFIRMFISVTYCLSCE